VSALLALTDGAVQAVKDIVSSSEQIPETAGLRMVVDASVEHNQVAFTIADHVEE
jgi:hypothetical protein